VEVIGTNKEGCSFDVQFRRSKVVGYPAQVTFEASSEDSYSLGAFFSGDVMQISVNKLEGGKQCTELVDTFSIGPWKDFLPQDPYRGQSWRYKVPNSANQDTSYKWKVSVTLNTGDIVTVAKDNHGPESNGAINEVIMPNKEAENLVQILTNKICKELQQKYSGGSCSPIGIPSNIPCEYSSPILPIVLIVISSLVIVAMVVVGVVLVMRKRRVRQYRHLSQEEELLSDT